MSSLNEAMKVFIKDLVNKMINVAFNYKSNAKMRQEMESEIEDAIAPILKKYGYIVESNQFRTKKFSEYSRQFEAYRYTPDYESRGYQHADKLISDLRRKYKGWSDEELSEFRKAMLDHFDVEIPDHMQ